MSYKTLMVRLQEESKRVSPEYDIGYSPADVARTMKFVEDRLKVDKPTKEVLDFVEALLENAIIDTAKRGHWGEAHDFGIRYGYLMKQYGYPMEGIPVII